MIDARLEDLLTRDADAVLEPREAAELDDLTAGNQDAAQARAEQRFAVAALGQVAPERAPLDLAHSVMLGVRATAGGAPIGLLRGGRPSLRYAAALAAGLVLGGLVVSLGRLQEAPESVSATMGAVPATVRVIDHQSLQDGDLDASIETRRQGSRVVVEITTAAAGVDAEMRFGAGLLPVGFERVPGAPGELSLGATEARLLGGGPGTYRLALEAAGAASPPVEISLSRGARRLDARVATAEEAP